MNNYIIIYLVSTLMALVLTPGVIAAAYKFNFLDAPNARKVHKKPIPRIGGIAIFLPVMTILSVLLLSGKGNTGSAEMPVIKAISLLCIVTFIFLVGLIDDISNLSAKVKLTCQLTAALVFCSLGFRINSIAFSESFVLNFGLFSWPLTILWIIGITNAVNLIDGLDGLAAGLCFVTCAVMAVLSLHFHQIEMTILMLALLGSLSGFLFFNFAPAKIFMGDCGSLFLGFVISTSSVLFASKSQAVVSLTLPILALGIPIFDTLFSMLRRFLDRRSMFSPDHEHFHHKLIAIGLKQQHIVITAYIITVLASGFGMFMVFTHSYQSIVIFLGTLMLLLLVFRVIGLFRIRAFVNNYRKKMDFSSQLKKERVSFEKTRLHFYKAENFMQWWDCVCLAAENLNFSKVHMPVQNRDGSERIFEWGQEQNQSTNNKAMIMTVPVSDRRKNSNVNINVSINANSSLESAGNRARLFNRLIEEFSISALRGNVKEEQLAF